MTAKEADDMFPYWCGVYELGGIKAVAEKFGRTRSTIYRMKKRYHWDREYKKIQKRTTRKRNTKIVKERVANQEVVRAVISRLGAMVLSQLKDKTYEGKVSELLAAIRLEEEMSG
ncbi:MAG: hypothetical protein KAV87_66265, partial [Desulfobacteraceae bacterium]|nr:hypothetical protein [Desulfobacteraceae bacterium]